MCGSCIICFMTARADKGKLDQGSRAEEARLVCLEPGIHSKMKNIFFVLFFHTLPTRRTCLVLTRGVRILITMGFQF